jgi:hypothetical protein
MPQDPNTISVDNVFAPQGVNPAWQAVNAAAQGAWGSAARNNVLGLQNSVSAGNNRFFRSYMSRQQNEQSAWNAFQARLQQRQQSYAMRRGSFEQNYMQQQMDLMQQQQEWERSLQERQFGLQERQVGAALDRQKFLQELELRGFERDESFDPLRRQSAESQLEFDALRQEGSRLQMLQSRQAAEQATRERRSAILLSQLESIMENRDTFLGEEASDWADQAMQAYNVQIQTLQRLKDIWSNVEIAGYQSDFSIPDTRQAEYRDAYEREVGRVVAAREQTPGAMRMARQWYNSLPSSFAGGEVDAETAAEITEGTWAINRYRNALAEGGESPDAIVQLINQLVTSDRDNGFTEVFNRAREEERLGIAEMNPSAANVFSRDTIASLDEREAKWNEAVEAKAALVTRVLQNAYNSELGRFNPERLQESFGEFLLDAFPNGPHGGYGFDETAFRRQWALENGLIERSGRGFDEAFQAAVNRPEYNQKDANGDLIMTPEERNRQAFLATVAPYLGENRDMRAALETVLQSLASGERLTLDAFGTDPSILFGLTALLENIGETSASPIIDGIAAAASDKLFRDVREVQAAQLLLRDGIDSEQFVNHHRLRLDALRRERGQLLAPDAFQLAGMPPQSLEAVWNALVNSYLLADTDQEAQAILDRLDKLQMGAAGLVQEWMDGTRIELQNSAPINVLSFVADEILPPSAQSRVDANAALQATTDTSVDETQAAEDGAQIGVPVTNTEDGE